MRQIYQNMNYSNLIFMLVFLSITTVSGVLGGLIYFDMNILEDNLLTVNFDIPRENNISSNITDFQDIMEIVVYPFLELRESIIYLTYFMVFGFIISLGIVAYLSTKNPVFFVVHLLYTLAITYFSFILSNAYINMLTQPFLNSLMTPFVVYNKIMLYLPQVVFFTSLLFGAISFISIIKPQSQFSNMGINYGGDY